MSRPFLGNFGLVVDGVDAAPGDVDGVFTEVWLVTWMVLLEEVLLQFVWGYNLS